MAARKWIALVGNAMTPYLPATRKKQRTDGRFSIELVCRFNDEVLLRQVMSVSEVQRVVNTPQGTAPLLTLLNTNEMELTGAEAQQEQLPGGGSKWTLPMRRRGQLGTFTLFVRSYATPAA